MNLQTTHLRLARLDFAFILFTYSLAANIKLCVFVKSRFLQKPGRSYFGITCPRWAKQNRQRGQENQSAAIGA